MRRFLAVSAVTGALGACTSAAGAATHHRHTHCPPPGATLVAGNGRVRVYTAPVGRSRFSTETRACVVRTGAQMTLIDRAKRHWPISTLSGTPLFSGSLVAYIEDQHGVDTGCNVIELADVERKRFVNQADGGCHSFLEGDDVTDLMIGPRASLAWILEHSQDRARTPAPLRVYEKAAGGPPVLLDEATDIGATSLAVSPEGFTWWRAGVLRSAPFPG